MRILNPQHNHWRRVKIPVLFKVKAHAAKCVQEELKFSFSLGIVALA